MPERHSAIAHAVCLLKVTISDGYTYPGSDVTALGAGSKNLSRLLLPVLSSLSKFALAAVAD